MFGYGRIAAVLAMSDRIYVGMDAGEWGGGLRVIDRKTGKITEVEGQNLTSKDFLLSSGYDPVNALTEVPWHPGC